MDDIQPVDVRCEQDSSSVHDASHPIYLDHHATTPVDPRVADVVMHAMTGVFGNANSIDHAFGEAAGALVATASEAVAALVGSAPEDVYFTSGSTEAIRLALAHAISQGRRSPLRVALTKVEHKAVIDAVSIAARSGQVKPCWVEVDAQGRLAPDSLQAALDAGVDLVCLMAANNEVGTIYPVPEVALSRLASAVLRSWSMPLKRPAEFRCMPATGESTIWLSAPTSFTAPRELAP